MKQHILQPLSVMLIYELVTVHVKHSIVCVILKLYADYFIAKLHFTGVIEISL